MANDVATRQREARGLEDWRVLCDIDDLLAVASTIVRKVHPALRRTIANRDAGLA